MAADISKKVEDQLWRWGIVLGAAGSLFAAALALFGFTSFEGAKARIDQAASAAAGELNGTASAKKADLEKQATAISGELKTDEQQAEQVIQGYVPREKAVDVNLQRLEVALKEQNVRTERLKQIRDASPETPIGSINSQLFQTAAMGMGMGYLGTSGTYGGTYGGYGYGGAGNPGILGTLVPKYSLGATGEGVKAIQSRLSALGCYSGPINGEFDSSTGEGVKAYKSALGKPITAGTKFASIAVVMPDSKLIPTSDQTETNPEDVGLLTWNSLFSLFSPQCNTAP